MRYADIMTVKRTKVTPLLAEVGMFLQPELLRTRKGFEVLWKRVRIFQAQAH